MNDFTRKVREWILNTGELGEWADALQIMCASMDLLDRRDRLSRARIVAEQVDWTAIADAVLAYVNIPTESAGE